MTTTTKFHVQYTDTFGGEANYCWVRNADIELPEKATDRSVVIAAKKAMGLSGVRGRMDHYGDMWEFRPYRSATVMFINVAYSY